jgi:DOPA 4,5-dioxygenase
MDYHAHIYWGTPTERYTAMAIREWFTNQPGCTLGRVWDQPVGPHPLPMYQVVYSTYNKDFIESFLRVNHETNSILLHESIKDDLRDHSEGVRWLGPELQLKLEIFLQEN